MSDEFDLLAGTQVFERSENIFDGRYRFIVDLIKLQESAENGKFFICEFEVLESTKVQVYSPEQKTVIDVAPNEKGSKCALKVRIDEGGMKGKTKRANAVKFLCALLGKPVPKEDDKAGQKALAEAFREAAAETQPARGMIIDASTHRQLTKNEPKHDITIITWKHVPAAGENNADAVAARRAKLERTAQAKAEANAADDIPF